MRGRFIIGRLGALACLVSCGGGFTSEPTPAVDGPDAATPDGAPSDGSLPTDSCPALVVEPPRERFKSSLGSPISTLKTDGVWLYSLTPHAVERVAASGALSYGLLQNDAGIIQIAVSTDALFYRIGERILWRTHQAFSTECGACSTDIGYTRLLAEGLAPVVLAGYNDSGVQNVRQIDTTGPRQLISQMNPTAAAVAPGLIAVTGKLGSADTAVVVTVLPDIKTDPHSISPVHLLSNGKLLFMTEADGTVSTYDPVARKKTTLKSGQPTPKGAAVLTTSHFWFGTDAGIRRLRIADGCVQAITTTLPSGFVVAGSSLFTIDGASIMESVVPN